MLAVRITTRDKRPHSRWHTCYAETVEIDTDVHVLPDGSKERVFDAYLTGVRTRKADPVRFPAVRVRDIADIAISERSWVEPLLYPVGGEREELAG